MWFWFIFMIIVNTLHTFYRVSTLFFDKLRFYQLFKTVNFSNYKKHFSHSVGRFVTSTTRTLPSAWSMFSPNAKWLTGS